MSSTTQFGDFPGVKISTSGGAITGVVVGTAQKILVYGVGDASDGTATVGDPTQVRSRRDAEEKFGTGTELTKNIKSALENGADTDFLYGVMVDVSATSETFTTTASGTVANAPVIEEKAGSSTERGVYVEDSTGAQQSVEFRHESPPGSPQNEDVAVNPHSGEWDAGTSGDYTLYYDYQSYDFTTADTVVTEDETATVVSLCDTESVTSALSTQVNTMRANYKMVRGLAPAEPNATGTDMGAELDTANYSDQIDNDAMFVFGPSRPDDSRDVFAGSVGGQMVGADIDQSVYNNLLRGVEDLEQNVTKTDADNLRNAEVMPVRDVGDVRLRDNLSTSTSTDWERDYWHRVIVDQTILIAKRIGETITGRINSDDTRDTAGDLISVELRSLSRTGVIKPNTEDEENWYVDVYKEASDKVGIDLGVTPFGIIKRVPVSITIDA